MNLNASLHLKNQLWEMRDAAKEQAGIALVKELILSTNSYVPCVQKRVIPAKPLLRLKYLFLEIQIGFALKHISYHLFKQNFMAGIFTHAISLTPSPYISGIIDTDFNASSSSAFQNFA